MALRDYPWRPLSLEETAECVAALNPVICPAPLDPDAVEARVAPLPFYADYQLIALIDHGSAAPNRRYALEGPEETVMLDGTNGPIYHVNQRAALRIDVVTAPQYAAFFFDHVVGRHGRFLIVETAADLRWTADAGPAVRAELADAIQPVRFEGMEDGAILLAAHMIFKTSLFASRIRIEPDGTIELTDEELLLDSLPLTADLAPDENPLHDRSEGQIY